MKYSGLYLTKMTLDELVGKLITYEMNVDKISESTKEKNLGLQKL